MHDSELIKRASEFHPWDAMSPAALGAILARGPFRSSAETGCGGSTIILSHASGHHTAFAIEGENRTISALRGHRDLCGDRVTFVEGETKATLPGYKFDGQIDLALLDGPHAYPLPQLELTYLLPGIRVGGWLVIDDIQIPSVYEIFRFLRKDDALVLEEVAVRTAFFRRTHLVERGPDGWELQGMNRHTVLRYSWRDRLRTLLKR
ncbi:MAG: class I SAM-dependent methyltransferase [Bryobacteraceae bacterium]